MKILVLSFFLPFWILPAPHAPDFYASLGPDLGQRVESVADACTFAAQNLIYVDNRALYHRTDYWQRPDLALQLGYGSCTAFCFVALKVAHDSGLGDGELIVVPGLPGEPTLHAVIRFGTRLYEPQQVAGEWPAGQDERVLGVMAYAEIPAHMWAVNDGPDRRKDSL